MKKYLLILVAVAGFALMQSCSKDVFHGDSLKEITIDTAITPSTDYTLQLAPLGDDDNIVDIIQQANHFSISRIENLTDVFNPVYHFVPDEKATGPQQVVLAISKNPNCKNYNKDSTIVYINFNIH